jgi:hypothetical protein
MLEAILLGLQKHILIGQYLKWMATGATGHDIVHANRTRVSDQNEKASLEHTASEGVGSEFSSNE